MLTQATFMKIYTKKGDFGETSLFGGKRISKSALRIEAYGNIDELNSFIGLAISQIEQIDMKHFLEVVQSDLMTITAYLAGFPGEKLDLELRVSEIEKVIDEIDKTLPKINHFILPGGGKLGATLHVVRSVARRAERSVVRLFNEDNQVSLTVERKKKILMYLNRVSDFFFVLARFANTKDNVSEETWKE